MGGWGPGGRVVGQKVSDREEVWERSANVAIADIAIADIAGADIASADIANADIANSDIVIADIAIADIADADIASTLKIDWHPVWHSSHSNRMAYPKRSSGSKGRAHITP